MPVLRSLWRRWGWGSPGPSSLLGGMPGPKVSSGGWVYLEGTPPGKYTPSTDI